MRQHRWREPTGIRCFGDLPPGRTCLCCYPPATNPKNSEAPRRKREASTESNAMRRVVKTTMVGIGWTFCNTLVAGTWAAAAYFRRDWFILAFPATFATITTFLSLVAVREIWSRKP
jgi:hypothetical protein